MSDDLLDETTTPKEKSVKKAKKKSEAKNGSQGRPASTETQELRARALKLAKRKNGIANIELAGELGVKTAQSQAILRPLVAAGTVKLVKDKETKRVVYQAA